MIAITSKNIYYSELPISTLSTLDNVDIIHIDEIVNFLSEDVEFGESVTLKRLFEIISKNLYKFNEVFYSTLGGHPLEPFLQEIENNPTELVECEYLEIHWFADKYEDELNICPSIHGVSKTDTSNEYFAIDFVSLNNLKNHIVTINRALEIYDYNKMKKLSEDDKDLEEIKMNLGNKAFTLFDIFNAIFYEISFHGGPQDKKERFDSLEGSIEESEKELEAGELKSITLEEMMEKLDSDDIYLVKYKELRDRVEEHRISDKRKLKKLKTCLIEKLKLYDDIINSDKDLENFYKKITDIEYSMQLLYGEKEDITLHKFWETPKCTCPVIDNLEIYPSKKPIFDKKCPIHGKK